ncbi:hypothetical protein CCR95_17715 [Thiocystis minor]|uniref:ElyC/SanA/YdcF family protein n=1 Tax=Thiocystis minor TaxID=61597 RepID=UPI0019130AC8|nr:ElyC/SanA/YdcF family protein [Thiocystis minor]MBK5965863.1 hypothetical protein [Thiocystis minor]
MTGALLCLLLASWRPVADAVLAPLENWHPPLVDPTGLDGVAAVVVLGGGWWPDARWPISAQLEESSAIRLFEGVRLLRVLPEARLVVSGASRGGEVAPVALGYAEAARALGVPRERILVLDTPVDTAGEADAVREALGIGPRLVLVTSASHMPRAVRHFRAVGLDPIPAPTHRRAGRANGERLRDWVPSTEELRKTETAWYEYLGLLALGWEHPRSR